MKKLRQILLVEDDKITNYIHEKLLLKHNLTDDVRVALNGKEALDFLTTKKDNSEDYQQPDLILLDINMPVMNGFEFMKEYGDLRSNQKAFAVVVMVTTSMLESDVVEGEVVNVEKYVNKPLTIEALQEIWQTYFSEKGE